MILCHRFYFFVYRSLSVSSCVTRAISTIHFHSSISWLPMSFISKVCLNWLKNRCFDYFIKLFSLHRGICFLCLKITLFRIQWFQLTWWKKSIIDIFIRSIFLSMIPFKQFIPRLFITFEFSFYFSLFFILLSIQCWRIHFTRKLFEVFHCLFTNKVFSSIYNFPILPKYILLSFTYYSFQDIIGLNTIFNTNLSILDFFDFLNL